MENWTPHQSGGVPSNARADCTDTAKNIAAQIEKLIAMALDAPASRRVDDNRIGYAAPYYGGLAGNAEVDFFQQIFRLRRLRERMFPGGLFADAAWDMLIDLYQAGLENRAISVSSVCIASSVPPTTALRHLAGLEAAGMLRRQPDPHDGRRIYVRLTSAAMATMAEWGREAASGLGARM